MPRPPSRLFFAAVTTALVLLTPTHATALPKDAILQSAGHSVETPGLFAKLWDLLSVILANGSGLEPNGTGSDASSEPDSGTTGDNGPGLDPNG